MIFTFLSEIKNFGVPEFLEEVVYIKMPNHGDTRGVKALCGFLLFLLNNSFILYRKVGGPGPPCQKKWVGPGPPQPPCFSIYAPKSTLLHYVKTCHYSFLVQE